MQSWAAVDWFLVSHSQRFLLSVLTSAIFMYWCAVHVKRKIHSICTRLSPLCSLVDHLFWLDLFSVQIQCLWHTMFFPCLPTCFLVRVVIWSEASFLFDLIRSQFHFFFGESKLLLMHPQTNTAFLRFYSHNGCVLAVFSLRQHQMRQSRLWSVSGGVRRRFLRLKRQICRFWYISQLVWGTGQISKEWNDLVTLSVHILGTFLFLLCLQMWKGCMQFFPWIQSSYSLASTHGSPEPPTWVLLPVPAVETRRRRASCRFSVFSWFSSDIWL